MPLISTATPTRRRHRLSHRQMRPTGRNNSHCQRRLGATTADTFPAVGHTYLVGFTADVGQGRFRVLLDFHSETSRTYTGAKADGIPVGESETVCITVEPIRDPLFLVTWKE